MKIDKKLSKEKYQSNNTSITSVSSSSKQQTKQINYAKIIIPVVLIIIIAALIVGYILLKKINDEANTETEETTSTIEVLNKAPSIPTHVLISTDEEELELEYVDDVWYWADDDKFPVDQEKANEVTDILTSINAYIQVDSPSADLSEYGLDEPVIKVTVQYSDDSSYVYSFGNTSEFNGYQYFKLDSDNNIYMLDTTPGTTLNITLDDLIETEENPLVSNTIVSEDVTSIVVSTEGGQANQIDDETGKADLFEYVYSLKMSSWEDYYADEEEMLNTFGINKNGDKVVVTYTTSESITNDDGTTSNVDVSHEFTVYIGHKFTSEDETEGYFYSPDGSTIVYSADAETIEAIMEYVSYVPSETTDEGKESEESEEIDESEETSELED